MTTTFPVLGKLGRFACLLTTACLLLTAPGCSRKQEAVQEVQKFDYPAPRYPKYLVNIEGRDLLPSARLAVRQSTGRAPLGKMQSGQEVYVLINRGQDMKVWEAIKQAWAERGVTAKTFGYWDVMGLTKEEYEARTNSGWVRGNEAWKEIGNFDEIYKPFFPESIQKEFGNPVGEIAVWSYLIPYLDKHPEIKYFYGGTGGGSLWQQNLGKHGDKFMGNFMYTGAVELLSKGAEFPTDLWNLVDEKIIRPIPFVSEVKLTDPEGTHLEWTVTPEQATKWFEEAGSSNHLYVYPNPLYSSMKEGGLIRAHANHTGIYPTMTVRLSKHGAVEKIEGGGRVGELFSMLVNLPKFQTAEFPKAPSPGYWFLRQDGFATNPKFVRNIPSYVAGEPWYANITERNRAGIQHMAFSYPSTDAEDLAYAKKNGYPVDYHHTSHMHMYFPTVQWKLRDTGEWVTIAEKGDVKAFGDAEIRALASKYGDPELIFRYEWIPEIPGINAPGEYEEYASNPWKWIMEQWESIENGKYQHYLEDYPTQRVQTQ